MNLALEKRLSPLAAWMILAGASATFFPLRLEQLYVILMAAMLLSALWLPGRRYRSAPFLALYAGTALLALNLTIPLPSSWHPILRLIVILGIWTVVLIIPLSVLLILLLRTARTRYASRHRW